MKLIGERWGGDDTELGQGLAEHIGGIRMGRGESGAARAVVRG